MRRLLVAAALVAMARGALAAEEGFEEEEPQPALALGPTRPASAVISGDLGWLRSGLRVDLGLGVGIDLELRLDAFVLSRGLGGQNAGYAGVRYSPFDGPGFRASATFELGLVFVPELVGTRDLFVLRGELVAGYQLEGLFLPYVRVAFRGLYTDATAISGWDHDAELGGGVEHAFGKLLVAAEASTWLQPGVRGLPQWRIRAGWSF